MTEYILALLFKNNFVRHGKSRKKITKVRAQRFFPFACAFSFLLLLGIADTSLAGTNGTAAV